MENLLLCMIADLFSIAGCLYDGSTSVEEVVAEVERQYNKLDITFSGLSKEVLKEHLHNLLSIQAY